LESPTYGCKMGFWGRLFKREREDDSVAQLESCVEEGALESKVHHEEILGTLDLGWYWSENKDEFQMAKIAQKDRATISMSSALPEQERQSFSNS